MRLLRKIKRKAKQNKKVLPWSFRLHRHASLAVATSAAALPLAGAPPMAKRLLRSADWDAGDGGGGGSAHCTPERTRRAPHFAVASRGCNTWARATPGGHCCDTGAGREREVVSAYRDKEDRVVISSSMMKDTNRNVQEILAATTPQHESKLHGVFHKLSDIWQPQPPQKMSSAEVLEPTLAERFNSPEGVSPQGAWRALARRLERELRAAKSARRLAAGEVLLPADLLPRVAREALRLADPEPCGLRGCTLHVNLETPDSCRRVSTIKLDNDTVSTFELYLTLRQDLSSWHSLLPQFLKNLTRGSTVVISPRFSLDKKKLYRSYLE